MDSVAYLIADNARMIRRSFDARVRELGMTGPQARLLMTLWKGEGENQGFYAERLEVEPISLCRMLDRLEEAELIERRRDPADRRAWRLFLTDRSRELIDQIRAKMVPLEDMILSGIDPTARLALATMLESVRDNLSAGRQTGIAANG
jgi:DNA-binding MarR family transcriptional regulator